MIVLGLTGSIGMGKSTTAQMFRDAGVPVHDADRVVHELYAGAAAPLVEAAFPGTVSNGVVDRAALAKKVVGNDQEMKKLEAIVHPLVQARKRHFLDDVTARGAPLAVLDIPLLFETGGDKAVDGAVVVTAPADVQRDRVLSREWMSSDRFEAILARQTPDAEKRRRADFVIDTSLGMESAAAAVAGIIDAVISGHWQPKRQQS